ncbi:MAG: hypothetical protein ACOY33_13540 [Pseudomonadota bacterium]
MVKPSKIEVETALVEARRMREAGEDDFFLARTLLNHHHRLHLLEEVYRAAAGYMHGESAQQHALLVRALDAYRRYDEAPG